MDTLRSIDFGVDMGALTANVPMSGAEVRSTEASAPLAG